MLDTIVATQESSVIARAHHHHIYILGERTINLRKKNRNASFAEKITHHPKTAIALICLEIPGISPKVLVKSAESCPCRMAERETYTCCVLLKLNPVLAMRHITENSSKPSSTKNCFTITVRM